MERKPLMGYYVTHRALRKDTDRIKTISSKFDQYSVVDWKKIAAWFDYHGKMVYYHHHGEDVYFFPWIKQRSSRFSAQLQKMDDEHKALDRFMEKMKNLFSGLRSGQSISREEFNMTTIAYTMLLINHLDEEEVFVEDALKEFKTEEIFTAEAQYLKQMPQEQKSGSLPWMVDVMQPEEREAFFSITPFFVKWIYSLSAKPKFEKMVSAI